MEHEDLIRRRAHEIWEAEGRPEGREARHWAQAEAEMNAPAPDAAPAASQADGRVIEAGEGGTRGGPDEADEALGADPGTSPAAP